MDGWEFKAGLVLGVHSAYFQGKLALLGLRRVTFSSPYWRSLNYPKKVTLNHLVDIQSSFWERAFLSFFWGCEYLLSGPGCLGIMENVIHVWSCLVSQWKYMGVSKNRGTPKWMVYINTKPYWIGWFGGTTISGNIHMISQVIQSVTQLDPLVGSEVTNDLFWDPKKVLSRIARLMFLIFLLHEQWKKPCLFRLYRGWNPTQLYWDFNKPI